MNSVSTAKALAGKFELAGRKWSYEYRALSSFNDSDILRYVTRQQPKFAAMARDWSTETNSEWICRHYLAAKMILMATLQLNSLEFARARNLRLVSPYLAYYSVFSLLRAVLFTVPESVWDGGGLIKLSHQKVGNLGFDHLRYLNEEWSASSATKFRRLRHERELISYWHPSSGDAEFEPIDDIIVYATVLAEVAQLNSEMLEAALKKHCKNTEFEFLHGYVEKLSQVELVGDVHVDWEDFYRLAYLARKWPRPTTLQHTITEGHVDDFFGAWCGEDYEDPEFFNPDLHKQLIFDWF